MSQVRGSRLAQPDQVEDLVTVLLCPARVWPNIPCKAVDVGGRLHRVPVLSRGALCPMDLRLLNISSETRSTSPQLRLRLGREGSLLLTGNSLAAGRHGEHRPSETMHPLRTQRALWTCKRLRSCHSH